MILKSTSNVQRRPQEPEDNRRVTVDTGDGGKLKLFTGRLHEGSCPKSHTCVIVADFGTQAGAGVLACSLPLLSCTLQLAWSHRRSLFSKDNNAKTVVCSRRVALCSSYSSYTRNVCFALVRICSPHSNQTRRPASTVLRQPKPVQHRQLEQLKL